MMQLDRDFLFRLLFLNHGVMDGMSQLLLVGQNQPQGIEKLLH